MEKNQNHEVVFEHGYEYDEEGRICGEGGQEVCALCGQRTDMMNSTVVCPVKTNPEIQAKYDRALRHCREMRLF